MQAREDLVNILTRQIAEKCMNCKYGRAKMECTRKSCYHKQVRDNLKKIDELNKEAITK